MTERDDDTQQPTRGGRKNEDGMKSLGKVVRILECFSVNDRALTLSEISQRTKYPKSTTHRLVAAMRDVGFLEQDRERDRYRLGLRLFEFGDIVLANLDVRREARPMMESLQQIAGHPVHLAVFDGMRAVVILRLDSSRETPPNTGFIENAPVHCTSLGKAMLAYQPADVLSRIFAAGLQRHTDQTMIDPEHVRDALVGVRENGYAVDNEEHQPGIRCVGAPILDQHNRVFAAISVSGPAWQISQQDVPDLAKVVAHQARQISLRLGWHG